MKKQILFTVLSIAFATGCQGQYPEHEVVDTACVQVFTAIDSAYMIIDFHPLSSGKRWNMGGGYVADPQAFVHTDTMYISISKKADYESLKAFANGHMESIHHDQMFVCGFYKFIMMYEDSPLFYQHFNKCNPNFLGRD